jgi:alpha-L-arabinofuranosidase
MRTSACRVPARSLMVLPIALMTLVASAQNALQAHIVLHADATLGAVSPLIFGANHRWTPDAAGSADPESGLTYPLTVAQIKDVGIALIAYPGGALADVYKWQRAIGPRQRRVQQVSGLVTYPGPLDSGFGPDEFGDLLEQTGAVGDLTVNIATASAADAADFVAYMASPVGAALVDGVDWPARRAANKHPKPYKIAYVGIGNEYEPTIQGVADQNSWINGEATSINAACAADKISCLYAFGGTTRFEHQSAVRLSDWREAASVSGGEPGLFMNARYAPVAAGSETVWVDGAPWRGLSDLDSAGADAKVYRINYQTGAISFGDGVHGAIPPKGSKISVSYTSGPHEGFVDFYRRIKAVNPNIKVCASIRDESFIRIMGAQHRYDCIQQHRHVISNPKTQGLSGGLNDFFLRLAAKTLDLGSEVQHTQQLINQYAGANATKVELVLSEYGQLGSFPAFAPHFARTEGQAVLTALCIREWVITGVAAAARTSLTDYTFAPTPAALTAVQLSDPNSGGDFALFSGPGPNTIVAPPAWAIRLLRQNTGTTLLPSSVEGSPKLSSSKGDSIDALQVYATRDVLGNAYLIAINVDPEHDIGATVEAAGLAYGPTAMVATLASANLNDENNPSYPQRVAIKETTVATAQGKFELSLPKHSVTGIKLTAGK